MRWRLVAAVAILGLAGCATGQDPAPAPATTATPATTAASPADGPAWRTLAAAPSQRTEVAAAAVGRRIWVLGGYAPDGATLATVEVYDTAADRWDRGPDLPVAVNHAMAATPGGVPYIPGGNDGDGPSAQVARLDGDRWRTLAPLPQGRSAGGLVALDGRLYLVGGVIEGGLAADTLVYDPAADRWSPAPGLPTPREHLGAAATDGKVYVVGGRVGGLGGNLATAEAFDPASGRWRPGRHRHRRRAGGGRGRRGRDHLPPGRGPGCGQRPLALPAPAAHPPPRPRGRRRGRHRLRPGRRPPPRPPHLGGQRGHRHRLVAGPLCSRVSRA